VSYKSPSIGYALKKLRTNYEEESQPQYLVVPYILTCAAYLEAKLNDSLHRHCAERYGDGTSKIILSLQLPKKLEILVPFMTDGQYGINKSHIVYQRLTSLIQVRNSITHAKPTREEIEASDEELIACSFMYPSVKLPSKFLEPANLAMDACKQFSPIQYHDALDKLEKWFFQRCPDKLRKVAIVTHRSKDERWRPRRITYEGNI
jgi:hypothetical protein